MTAKTTYTVDLQTKTHQNSPWERTSWPVIARDKDNARTQAIEDARNAGLHGEIRATAKANNRPMNTEILRRLSGTPSESELATAVLAAIHNKCFYAADGTLMTVEVKRSIFDDVDK